MSLIHADIYNVADLNQSWKSLSSVLFAISAKYTVYRRIVNTPATEKVAIADENKPAHLFGFFSASQKTLSIFLIR